MLKALRRVRGWCSDLMTLGKGAAYRRTGETPEPSFIYLTGVTSRTGRHRFVARSNRRFAQPHMLIDRGYARIADADIARHYSAHDIVEILGPRGTMIFLDTRAYHKGKALEEGDRLLLDLKFCDILFPTWTTLAPFTGALHPRLVNLFEQHPRIYRRYSPAIGGLS